MTRTLLSFRIEAWLLERLLYYYAGGMVQDKWVHEGRELERERIIKLLDEVLKFDSEQEKRNLFALITGEQK